MERKAVGGAVSQGGDAGAARARSIAPLPKGHGSLLGYLTHVGRYPSHG